MKKISTILKNGAMAVALCAVAIPFTKAAEVEWGDFKIFLDPGHSMTENKGLWGYSEAEKTLRVALDIEEFFKTYTDIEDDEILLCRYTDDENVELEERTDVANAWGADFYYSIHSDSSSPVNTTVTLFGGWRNNGVDIEKTPNGGKAFGEILNPNLTNVMRITTRGNYYDRCYYDPEPATHTNQYPYLSVNRRSNMPSLLSEGGYHDIASQQQLNINDDYKRIEALAGFQSILTYRDLPLPEQTMLAGIITNSENDVPINGVTVEVDGRTYTTNTWEDTFSAYTKNENLIHNGFYFFEGLEAEKSYDVTFTADGFESTNAEVTIKKGDGGETLAYVTYLDIQMTNVAPAKVDGISITDFDAVSPVTPIEITFSRNMDRESVEEALSINNNGEISLSWDNDYTLVIDISQLQPLFTYRITIDGSIAKNSQTGQFFDGDGDGEEGGDYTIVFTMAEPDETPAEVVSTYPPADGEAEYTYRPPIRIEFSETLDWNDDKYADFVTVTDKDGTEYEGTLAHTIVGDASVLHFYLNEDLPLDKCFLVSVKEGLPDLSGNLSSDYYFRFLSEYRTDSINQTILTLDDISDFWTPDGSGTTVGLTEEGNTLTDGSITCSKESAGSIKLNYSFDIDDMGGVWHIREHYVPVIGIDSNDGILTFWVYGDGSNNDVSAMVRVTSSGGGVKYPANQKHLDFRGWGLVTWDLANDEYLAVSGTDEFTGWWQFDAFYLTHVYDDEDEDDPDYQAWSGELYFDNLELHGFDDTAERTAKITDIDLPTTGIEEVIATASPITISYDGSALTVTAPEAIDLVEIYNIAGVKVANVKPNANTATISVENLVTGVYVAKAVSKGNAATTKFIK